MAWSYDDLKALGADAKAQAVAQIGEKRKQNKCHNRKTEVNGIVFDSISESRRYGELMLMLKAGTIRNLKLQPEFTLQEAYKTVDGTVMPAIRYRADFSYERKTKPDTYGYDHWTKVVEDVKSPYTRKKPEYRIKMKEFHDRYGIPVTEVIYGKKG